MPLIISIFPSEWIASSAVSKLNSPPVIVKQVSSVVSLYDTLSPLALYKVLLKAVLEAPSVNVFILNVPSLIINLFLAWNPSL